MVDDLIPILTRFHREIVLPDIERVVGAAVDGLRTEIKREFAGHLDAIYKRFDRLETEYHMLVAGLKRVEERLDKMEQRLDKLALKSDLLELKARVDTLQAQVRALEDRISA